MDFLLILLWLIILVAALIGLYIARQGNAEFEFVGAQRTEFVLTEKKQNSATFTCKVPYINKGAQDGTLVDVYTRHLLPCEQYDAVEVVSYIANVEALRTDGYWEALIVPKGTGGTSVVTVKLVAKNGNIDQALADMPDMNIDLVYQVISRTEYEIQKNRIVLLSREVQKALNAPLTAE